MNRITITFFVFLTLTTLGAGTAYQNLQNLFSGYGDGWQEVSLLLSAAVFGMAMLVLGRILYLTPPKKKV